MAITQMLEQPQNQPIIELTKGVGRPKAITEQKVLFAIAKWGTKSPYELAEKLNTSHMTVYRRLRNIPQEEIDQILEDLAHTELKPAEMEWDVFEQMRTVQEYKKKLLDKAQVSEDYARKRMRSLFHICCVLRRRPSNLTVEQCADLVAKIRRGEVKYKSARGIIPMGIESTRKTVRSWFELMHKISGKALTLEGVDAEASAGTGQRSQARLTMKQRHAFMRVLKEKVKTNWEGKSGRVTVRIPFGDEPHLAQRMLVLPKAYYYWGNRKMSVLNALIEDMQWQHSFGRIPFGVQKLIDKGLHKKGRTTWYKDTTGELLEEMKALYEALGKPSSGKWFPFSSTQLTTLFKECYVEAGIPESLYRGMPIHIWRHTACQDLLDATHRNWDIVADRLAWKSIDTMKKHYGKTSPDDLRKALLEAMGIKVKWEKKEFKF